MNLKLRACLNFARFFFYCCFSDSWFLYEVSIAGYVNRVKGTNTQKKDKKNNGE